MLASTSTEPLFWNGPMVVFALGLAVSFLLLMAENLRNLGSWYRSWGQRANDWLDRKVNFPEEPRHFTIERQVTPEEFAGYPMWTITPGRTNGKSQANVEAVLWPFEPGRVMEMPACTGFNVIQVKARPFDWKLDGE